MYTKLCINRASTFRSASHPIIRVFAGSGYFSAVGSVIYGPDRARYVIHVCTRAVYIRGCVSKYRCDIRKMDGGGGTARAYGSVLPIAGIYKVLKHR